MDDLQNTDNELNASLIAARVNDGKTMFLLSELVAMSQDEDFYHDVIDHVTLTSQEIFSMSPVLPEQKLLIHYRRSLDHIFDSNAEPSFLYVTMNDFHAMKADMCDRQRRGLALRM